MADNELNGHFGRCWKCNTLMWLPESIETTARANEAVWFYCPHGHRAHYAEGETNEAKLRRERDRLAQQVAQRDDEIKRQRELREAAERQAAAARGQVTKLKKRVTAGVCPCCNRTFAKLQRHMATKHPTFTAEEVAHENVVSIIKACA